MPNREFRAGVLKILKLPSGIQETIFKEVREGSLRVSQRLKYLWVCGPRVRGLQVVNFFHLVVVCASAKRLRKQAGTIIWVLQKEAKPEDM